jgi:hypothetical protein
MKSRLALILALLCLPVVPAADAQAELVWATADGTVRVSDEDGSPPLVLTGKGGDVSMSPDGRYVSWKTTVRGATRTVLASTDSRSLRELPNRAFAVFGPVWGADDRFVADAFDARLRIRPALLGVASGQLRILETVPSGITFAGDASPDGRRLALERLRIGPGASVGAQLSILDSARHEIELVGTSGAFSVLVHRGVDPAWGPADIAYTRPRGEDGDLKIITPNGRVLMSVRRAGRWVHPVGWLADGRLLAAAFDHVNEHAILVDPVTGAVETLPGTYARISGVKRDGSAMLVLTRDGGAASVSLAGGQATPLIAPGGAKGLVESVAWSR